MAYVWYVAREQEANIDSYADDLEWLTVSAFTQPLCSEVRLSAPTLEDIERYRAELVADIRAIDEEAWEEVDPVWADQTFGPEGEHRLLTLIDRNVPENEPGHVLGEVRITRLEAKP